MGTDPKSISSPYLAMTAPSACSSGGPVWLGGSSGAISAKYRSNPAGEMISSARAGASPAFQNACGTPLGLKTRSPVRATRTASQPGRRPRPPGRRCTRPRARACASGRPGRGVRSGVRRGRRSPALSTLDHEPYSEPAHQHLLALIRRQHYSDVRAPHAGHGRPPPFAPQTPLDGNIVTGCRPVKPSFARSRRPERFPSSRGPQVLY